MVSWIVSKEGWDMRVHFWAFAVIVACGVSSAMAGIAVSSFDTQAQTNAYAPLDKSAYYAVDDHPNASSATGDLSENWFGTNIGGSSTTWNMVTSAQISTATTSTAYNLTITGAGSFNYNITTTAEFVDPTSVTTLYGPGAGGDYQCYFTIDTPAIYNLTALLSGSSVLYFASFQTGVIVNKAHFGGLASTVSQSGTIAPGQYEIRANTSLGGRHR